MDGQAQVLCSKGGQQTCLCVQGAACEYTTGQAASQIVYVMSY
jgi:hypothetical protein